MLASAAITDVRFSSFSWKRDVPISNGVHTYTHSALCVVEIETTLGITGYGLAPDPGFLGGENVLRAAIEMLAPGLVGSNAFATDTRWHEMWVPKLVGRRGLITRAISAIDIALWDIKAKFAGLPLTELLGGERHPLRYYVAGGYYEPGKSTSDLIDEIEKQLTSGATAIKLKVGRLSITEDVARVAAVRRAVGDGIDLLVDANAAYRAHEAVVLARALEPLGIFWLEEPVAPDDYRGYRHVRSKTSIPIAGGENEYTLFGFRDLIAGDCVDIVNADAQVLGGITEFMKVAALAQAYGVSIAPHGNQDLHAHLLSSIDNALILEYYPAEIEVMWHKFHRSELTPHDGLVTAGGAPGVGIALEWDQLRELRGPER